MYWLDLRASMLVLGIPEAQFWRMTLREVQAIQRAHINKIRIEWNGVAEGLAAYFEGHRDPKKGGRPVTRDSFLPMTRGQSARLEKAMRALTAVKERIEKRRESKEIPKWAELPEGHGKRRKRSKA